MAKISSLTDNTNQIVYPQTKANAVIMEDSTTVENAIAQRPKMVLSAEEPASTIADNTLYGVYGDVGQITTGEIADSAVTTAKIASSAVTEAKLGTGAVTADKLGSSAVTTAKINSLAVTTAKIANGAVTGVTNSATSIGSAKLALDTVGTPNLRDGAVTSDKVDWTTFALPAATKYGSADITISASGSYNGQNYTGLNRITTNNSEYFEASTYGITVKKAGLYLVSGYINLDLSSNAVQWRMQGTGITAGTIDIGEQIGMAGFFFPAQIAQYSANTNVYPVLAFQKSGSVISRGVRSYITIIKIG